MEWKAWFITMPVQYGILRFDSDTHTFEDLPKDGAIAFKFGDIRLVGYDWYFIADGYDGFIYGADNDSRLRSIKEDISSRYINPLIFRGIWVTSTKMDKVYKELWQ